MQLPFLGESPLNDYDGLTGMRCPTAGAYKPKLPNREFQNQLQLRELAATPGFKYGNHA
jgi:hypothetical protein